MVTFLPIERWLCTYFKKMGNKNTTSLEDGSDDEDEIVSEDEKESTSNRPNQRSPVEPLPPTDPNQQRQNSSNKLLTYTILTRQVLPSTNPGYTSSIVNTRELFSPPSEKLEKTPLPVVVKRNVYLPPQIISNKSPIPTMNVPPPANAFEKAPMVQLNYVVKSFDNKSSHTYGLETITVMRRTSSQAVQLGNRWYDYNYHTNPKYF